MLVAAMFPFYYERFKDMRKKFFWARAKDLETYVMIHAADLGQCRICILSINTLVS